MGKNAFNDPTDVTSYGNTVFIMIQPLIKAMDKIFNDDGGSCGGYILHQDKGSNNLADLVFGTSASINNPQERMRIDSSGRVGIGDNNPDVAFFVHMLITTTQ